jgi:hypothetical protein
VLVVVGTANSDDGRRGRHWNDGRRLCEAGYLRRAATGGKIADGTYDLTEVRRHSGAPAGGASFHEAIRITAGLLERASDVSGAEDRQKVRVTYGATAFTVAEEVCGSGIVAGDAISYSTLSETQWALEPIGGNKIWFVFTKR